MIPGTFFFDREFQFHDGEDGRKIFVTLGTIRGITLAAKTTSKGKHYLYEFGCQVNHRFPHFHLVKDCCCLNKPTWIVLDEFYEFNDTQLLQKHFSGVVNRLGTLPDHLTIALMECSRKSEDISSSQTEVVGVALEQFQSASQ